ncbi:MAG: hypothetical protein C5B52_00330 [Bacteroidetes bacterium]|nr:MAG: hypothetical protein C5B52_00330 [Bacteroidota bacterium]
MLNDIGYKIWGRAIYVTYFILTILYHISHIHLPFETGGRNELLTTVAQHELFFSLGARY